MTSAQKIATSPSLTLQDHERYMALALSQARLSPPSPTNFCVGAVLVDTTKNVIISTGYTHELPGNTHAEQCCFMKLDQKRAGTEASGDQTLLRQDAQLALYTTMEPCNLRLSGNKPCVDRILELGEGVIRTVYVGVSEPETFVGQNTGRKRLEDAGIEYVVVTGMEDEILKVATAGHVK